jgi:hypothetical protein
MLGVIFFSFKVKETDTCGARKSNFDQKTIIL